MKILGLLAIFVVSLVIALVATFPLSQALSMSGVTSRGLTYDQAYGTVWDGVLTGVKWINQPVGRVDIQTEAAAVLGGALKLRVNASGRAGMARANVALSADGVTLSDGFADLNIQEIVYLDQRLRQTAATLNLSLSELSLRKDGTCRSADGGMQSDILEVIGRQWNWSGPPVVGQLACEGDDLKIMVQNSGGSDQLDAQSIIQPGGSNIVTATVTTRNPQLDPPLIGLGFENRDGVYHYRKVYGAGS